MKIFFLFCIIITSSVHGRGPGKEEIPRINMYIGTSYSHNISDVHDYGNTMLNIGIPFAHTTWTPQTHSSEDKCQSPYYYFDSHWQGMRRTHWMSGSCVIDYGTATILPSLVLNLYDALHFHKLNHDNEVLSPYSYKVSLPESNMEVEVASKNSAGIFRASMTSDSSEYFYLLLLGSDSMYNESSVEFTSPDNDTVFLSSPVHRWYQSQKQWAGFAGHHYFKASRTPVEIGIIHGYGENVEPNGRMGKSSSAGPAVAYMKFLSEDGPVTVATGCSYVSTTKAEFNARQELKTGRDVSLFDMETIQQVTKKSWQDQFDLIQISPTEEEVHFGSSAETFNNNSIVFYTALWHSMLLPRKTSDADGAYLSFTDNYPRTVMYTHESKPDTTTATTSSTDNTNKEKNAFSFGTYYDDFSMWDIFRAQIPLLHLLQPKSTIRDMVASLVVKAQQGHWLPIFPAWNSYTGEMIGDHCTVLITDAVLKGIIAPDDPILVGGNDAKGVKQHGALFFILQNALRIPTTTYEYEHARGRRAIQSYLTYGFIPIEDQVTASPHQKQQVSRSLEYSFDDFVIAQLLQFLSTANPSALSSLDWSYLLQDVRALPSTVAQNNENEVGEITQHEVIAPRSLLSQTSDTTADVIQMMRARGNNYKLVIDGDGVGFVRAKHTNGTWAVNIKEFDPMVYYKWLTETNVWQYTWFAPHDIEGLIELYGGAINFTSKLNTFFDGGWYNHGNEPDHHSVFLYSYLISSGKNVSATPHPVIVDVTTPALTAAPATIEVHDSIGGSWQMQQKVNEIIRSQYSASERGMSGNDDAGQMSAWLVLSSIGIYQVCPGCGVSALSARIGTGAEYVLGVPLFDDITVHLAESKALHIVARGRSDASKDWYIQEMFINGVPNSCGFVTHDVVTAGGLWEFVLGDVPNKEWGSKGRSCIV